MKTEENAAKRLRLEMGEALVKQQEQNEEQLKEMTKAKALLQDRLKNEEDRLKEAVENGNRMAVEVRFIDFFRSGSGCFPKRE